MKQIILCADDYGQNTAISQAIINLIALNRLSATSCMSNSYYWLTHANWLLPVKETIDIGLHFNLTEGSTLTKDFPQPISLSQLILKAYLKKLNQQAIENEFNAQIDQFIKGLGQLPHFIDGHQHIHQLPIIRDAIIKVYKERLINSKCYIRSVSQPHAFWNVMHSGYFKFMLIQLCGAFQLKKLLAKESIPHNITFSGSYDFSDAKKYAKIFPQFLKQIRNQGIIMCHPGLQGSIESDIMAKARYFEYQFFQSDLFIEQCKKANVTFRKKQFV